MEGENMGISSVGTLESAAVSQNRMTVQYAEARQSRGTGQEAASREAAIQPADAVSKNIQDEISEVQRQKQGLSSKQEMSEAERSKKKQELQQKLNSLNMRLRQRQAEVSRKQKQADRLEELSASDTGRTHRTEESGRPKTAPDRESGKNTRQGMDAEAPVTKDAVEKMTGAENTERSAGKTERNTGTSERNTGMTERNTGMTGRSTGKTEYDAGEIKRSTEDNRDEQLKASGIPQDKMLSIVNGEISIEQTDRREAVIARIEGGIAILKGEIRQDEMLGNDVQKKKAELKSREMKVRNAINELPVINAPGRKSDEILRNAGKVKADNEERAKARIFKRSRDGVVVLKSDNEVFAAAADV